MSNNFHWPDYDALIDFRSPVDPEKKFWVAFIERGVIDYIQHFGFKIPLYIHGQPATPHDKYILKSWVLTTKPTKSIPYPLIYAFSFLFADAAGVHEKVVKRMDKIITTLHANETASTLQTEISPQECSKALRMQSAITLDAILFG
jgi:hypothetical protein